ncbi:hypothetical protein FRB94_012842 [Tulasnella sp. JGI-2019a]|nr:hypothetical protein FRB94_012842 [Tulasnella sp. JGI-2019a]KAG9016388.1 hypothetical protein FRB93_010637 [Tulasnella sp. JGI-2019a]
MDDYMAQALDIFLEGASRTALTEPSLNDLRLTELQRSTIMIRSFDDGSKTFRDGLHRLRSAKAQQHNTLLPISRLPNELLVKIFAFASVLKSGRKNPPVGLGYFWHDQRALTRPGSHGPTMLATLVFVCHRWRGIMYNAPSLWAYIRSDRPHGANLECLARSDQAPLRISFNLDHTDHQDFRTKLFQEVHRWKSVKMTIMTMEHLKDLEQRPAPLLEKFDVRYRRDMAGPPMEVPNLFCGSASRLRHLTLVNITIPWESNLLSCLKTLHIRTEGLSAQQVVHILQSCPDLSSFKLDLPPGIHPGPMPQEASTIELPRLEHLLIRVHSLMTEHLLRRMRIPTCKAFDIYDTGATRPTFSPAMEHLIPSLSSIHLAASKLSIHISSTALRYEATAKIDKDDGDELEKEEEDSELVQRMHILAAADPFNMNSFILETLSWLLDKVQTPSSPSSVFLDIPEIDSPTITPIIDQLSPVITKLTVGSASLAKIILSYLAEPSKVVIDGITTLRWPLPRLTDLSFERCDHLEPEVILACVQRRTGRELSSEESREHHKELPARLTRLRLPCECSTAEAIQMFPDCMEWCGLENDEEASRYYPRDLYGFTVTD